MSSNAGTVSAGMLAEQPRGCLHASDSMCRCIFCLRTRVHALTDRPAGDLERFLKRRIWFQRQLTLLKKCGLKQMRRIPQPKEWIPSPWPVEEVSRCLTRRIQRLLGTLSPWWLNELPPLKQTWNDQSQDHRFHGLARRVELHRLNLTLSWKCLQVEHGLLMSSKNDNQSELHFRERARRAPAWSQKTRLPTCQRKRRNLGRSLPITSPQWGGILLRAKIVLWLTVTLRFVLSVLVRWVWTWRSWRLCTLRL